ncbi:MULTISPECIES: SagB/ThcOx family dehydrogenase [Thermoplasmatales]|nr:MULTISPECIES: SagB/ThcOx family dehydrogenase [Thermoplasmatales]MCI2413101.1 SagB/ThcOx family dehydrogenase [Cuniculiplasma sp.]NOL60252.1 SagB/ThcOx family dehydrogenase [Ferroplasma acidiphilum]WMT53354.1 MAG: SagB/ThcOx family dehydrogenase [Ferroplasma acidiphilum]SIM33801.1 nitroreductase [Cuniculiplasma divulgatum]SJK84526.1 nitroreductase [Cuniculiplasma divulgatum]
MKTLENIKWKELTTIDNFTEPSRLIISNPLLYKRIKIKLDAFIEFLLFNQMGNSDLTIFSYLREIGFLINTNEEPETENLDSILHWFKRGWYDSLIYYVWSKKVKFIDDEDYSGDLRRGLINAYLSENSLPDRIVESLEFTKIKMPIPKNVGLEEVNLKNVLLGRRTTRIFQNESMKLEDFSSILWNALSRVRHVRNLSYEDPLDYFASHGTEFDFYVIAYNINHLQNGIYLYDVKDHFLSELKSGDFREEMIHNLWWHQAPKTANFTILFVTDFEQYQWRYRHERALRNIFIEAGRIAQRLIFEAERMGFGSLPTPATRDSSFDKMLSLKRNKQFVLYTITVGKKPSPSLLMDNTSSNILNLQWVNEI